MKDLMKFIHSSNISIIKKRYWSLDRFFTLEYSERISLAIACLSARKTFV